MRNLLLNRNVTGITGPFSSFSSICLGSCATGFQTAFLGGVFLVTLKTPPDRTASIFRTGFRAIDLSKATSLQFFQQPVDLGKAASCRAPGSGFAHFLQIGGGGALVVVGAGVEQVEANRVVTGQPVPFVQRLLIEQRVPVSPWVNQPQSGDCSKSSSSMTRPERPEAESFPAILHRCHLTSEPFQRQALIRHGRERRVASIGFSGGSPLLGDAAVVKQDTVAPVLPRAFFSWRSGLAYRLLFSSISIAEAFSHAR